MVRKLLAAFGSLVALLTVVSLWAPSASAFSGAVNDSGVRVRSAPSLSADVVKTLSDGQQVDVVDSADGSSVGGNSLWYQLPSGGWVNSRFVTKGGSSAGAQFSGRWVDVNISTQTARAMEGGSVVYTAAVTTGRPGWPTPTGTFYIQRRLASTTMDSSTIGISRNAPGGYYVPNVLYTQYFDDAGDALHYNYWMPSSVFGNTPTSHGCVGMPLGAAQFFWNFADYGTPVVIHY